MLVTPSGAPANSIAALPQASLDGKIDTTMMNFGFSSRPFEGLGVRVRYRSYEYKDKSARFFIPGDTAQGPEAGRWWTNTATEEDPYGHATANRTDAKTAWFSAEVSYDVKDLTIEGAFRNIDTSWVGRQASSGTDGSENVFALSAVYHSSEWLGFRATVDWADRSVSGIEAGSVAQLQGVMADHAERDSTRVGLDVEVTPSDKWGLTFAYFRRNDDFTNRPNESSTVSGTESGLLEAKYDTYTIEGEYTPSQRAEISAYYTYEKNTQTNQWLTLISGSTNVNNLLNYAGRDKSNTFGANAVLQFVPDKWIFSLGLSHQKVDGFMDITSNTSGAAGCCSFYNGRTTLNPPGAQDINDLDDTQLTTVFTDLAYKFAKTWTWAVGYAYQDYSVADAYSDGTTMFPQSVLFFMKANDNDYNVNVVYTRLNYRF
jgi:hypothetical protein